MSQHKLSNVSASVRQRLVSIIRETGDDANLVWTCYATGWIRDALYFYSVIEFS